jgi:hypothetical protein
MFFANNGYVTSYLVKESIRHFAGPDLMNRVTKKEETVTQNQTGKGILFCPVESSSTHFLYAQRTYCTQLKSIVT